VPDHFYKPPRSSRWYVRLIAPEAIRDLVDKIEFRQSTGHSDIHKAKPVGLALLAEKRREWASLEAQAGRDRIDFGVKPTTLTGPLIDSICAARLYASLAVDEHDRSQSEGLDDDALRGIEEFCALTDVTMRSVLAQGPASPRWSDLVQTVLDWCWTMGYELESSDPMFVKLVRSFAAVEKDGAHRMRERNQGNSPPSPPVPTRIMLLSSVTEAYRKYKAPSCGESHLGTLLNVWILFIEHCGDIPLDSVTPGHVYEFLQARMHADHKPWSGMRALQFGRPTLREIFGLARTRNLMTRSNPVDEMDVPPPVNEADEAKHQKPRFPFTTKQLNTIFSSAWYDPTDTKSFTGKMKSDLGARYWVPLISLFHGNRVREALQLTPGDFWLDEDVLVMSYQIELNESTDADAEEAETPTELGGLRRLKNAPTRRIVPVHPVLIELGFDKFIDHQRQTLGSTQLMFPSSWPKPGSKKPKLGRAYEQSFLRYVRDGLEFGHGYGNHSFRHQLEDRVRAAQRVGEQWPAGMGQQYTGRKRTRAADRHDLLEQGSEALYGSGYPHALVRQYIARMDFSDVALPQPYATWIKQAN